MVKLDSPSKLETTDITRHFSRASKKPKNDRLLAEDLQRRLIVRLEEDGDEDLAATLKGCSEIIRLNCTGCGNTHQVRKGCRQKWCPVCVRAIATKRSLKYSAAVEAMQWPLFTTFTMPNCEIEDIDGLRRLRRAFGKLRHKKLWSQRVKGGVAGVEVTNIGNGWHFHLHAVVDCRWLAWKTPAPQRGEGKASLREKYKAASDELGLAWARCLGVKSFDPDWCGVIFKVKRCNTETISREVLKYSVKGSDLVECSTPPGPLIRSMQATRLVTSFGSLFGKNRVQAKDSGGHCACEKCGGQDWLPDCVVDGIARASQKARRR